MSKRFTDTEKWKDPWYRGLSQTGKLLFNYVCDQCDIAGFWEIDIERAVFDMGILASDIEWALKEIERCYETNNKYIWIKRFIEFQGNFPLNKNNKAHLGIIRMLTERESFSENITRILNGEGLPSSFEGPNKGLFSSLSISKGIGKGNSNLKSKDKSEKYSPEFEEFWKIFVELDRAEAKPSTYDHWNATLKGRNGGTGHPPVAAETIIQAAKNYRDYCLAEGTTRNYIMQSASFVGPKKRGWEGYLKPKKVSKKGKNEIGLVIPVENGVYSHLGRQK